MLFMQEEMQNDFKKDLKEGKIFGLRLVETQNEVIRRNVYADIFGTIREIVGYDDKKFYLRTRRSTPYYLKETYNGSDYVLPDFSLPEDEYYDAEGYFEVFNYYDGNRLKSSQEFSAMVNQKDIINITEYEVIRSY